MSEKSAVLTLDERIALVEGFLDTHNLKPSPATGELLKAWLIEQGHDWRAFSAAASIVMSRPKYRS